MNVRESVRIAWRSITSHKLRSTLTTIGVIIGVAAVITFMVLGSGFSASIVGDIEAEQEPVMVVQTQTEPEAGVGIVPVDTPIYSESDVETLQEFEDVAFVAPEASVDVVQTATDDEQVTGVIDAQATTADRFEHTTFVEGEPFDGPDEVVVNEPASRLFEGNLSAGDELELSFEDGEVVTVTVTGVVEREFGEQTPPQVFLPVDPYYETTIETPDGDQERAYPTLQVGAENFERIDPAQEAVVDYLEAESHAAELKAEDDRIEVQTVEDAIEQFTDIVDQLTLFIGAVAAIALVVGSIGIANIMIVSVTERTREIGIMKAVGATKRDVMQLFLVESVILGVIGALVGVAAGLGAGYLGVRFLEWPMAYPVDWIAIAIAVGIGVGVVSGLYPAWRGARVDPIEALRHE
ncbi:putative ABC transport system permease protein [Halobiforma haloterrestris]|uniref:Putative ABC transport system permease protein n=1 Tax=Natronobacterium haloterrestre TaxID=148448 RepID=A0A1I1DA65_NATHA|nr:ABC transporter permease [Halobiforma haloterrestris]SFB69433.1 putative ABC transport system permease protein [Halobiforma haloterrestris]